MVYPHRDWIKDLFQNSESIKIGRYNYWNIGIITIKDEVISLSKSVFSCLYIPTIYSAIMLTIQYIMQCIIWKKYRKLRIFFIFLWNNQNINQKHNFAHLLLIFILKYYSKCNFLEMNSEYITSNLIDFYTLEYWYLDLFKLVKKKCSFWLSNKCSSWKNLINHSLSIIYFWYFTDQSEPCCHWWPTKTRWPGAGN